MRQPRQGVADSRETGDLAHAARNFAVYHLVILHSTSGIWDQMPSPAPTVACDAVRGYDTNHVLFGCADGIHQYDGATWTSSLASTNRFYGLSGSNVNAPSVFAVGIASDGTTGAVYHLLLGAVPI